MSEALADVREGFSKKEIKMAIGIASDPRYKGGNYTGAFNAIEKIKKGLAKHPQVAAVLKRQNEEIVEKYICPKCEGKGCDHCDGKGYHTEGLDKEDEPFVKDLIQKLRGGSKTHAKQADDLEKAMKEDGHADVSSAMRQCKTITEDATEIDSKLRTMSPEDNLPTWWTNKLAVASNSMNKMRDYIVNPIQEETELGEGYEKEVLLVLKDAGISGSFRSGRLYVDKQDVKDAKSALKDSDNIKSLPRIVGEEVELDEMKEPFVVIDTADGDKVVGMASSEKGAKSIITTAQLPPMKIKDKKTLKIVKVKKKQDIGYPLKEGTWAVPETPAQKRDLKKLLSKPLPLGKEGENASDKMYSIIGDDELFDDLYSAGKESPDSDARPIIKKAMKRLKIREDSWDSWRLEESTKPDHIKVFNSLKRGDKVEINYDSAIAGGTTKTFVIKTKNKVYKGKVDKVTMYPDGKTGGVKFHLYQYDNRPGVYMAIGDMGASLRDIKKI